MSDNVFLGRINEAQLRKDIILFACIGTFFRGSMYQSSPIYQTIFCDDIVSPKSKKVPDEVTITHEERGRGRETRMFKLLSRMAKPS